MSKKVIAVDLDDVLSASAPAFVQFSNERWGTNLTVEDYHEHWAELWGVDHQEVERRSREYTASKLYRHFKVHDDALEVLRELSQEYKLVIATARRKEQETETLAWLEEHYSGIFDNVYFAGIWDKIDDRSHVRSKSEICSQIEVDYLIDDQPRHCFSVAKDLKIPTLLFGDYPWNRQVKLAAGITRVKDWQAVKAYFFDGQK